MRDVLDVLLVVPGNIPGLLGPLELQSVLAYHRMLDQVAASLVDRVSDIGIKLIGCPFDVLKVLGPSQTLAALVAIIAPHVIFRTATTTPRGHLATGHRNKRPIRALDDLQIPNHKSMVQGDRTESPKAILRGIHEFDSNLSYIHRDASLSPLNRRSGSRMGDDRYLLA
jgi:hypothetical protein